MNEWKKSYDRLVTYAQIADQGSPPALLQIPTMDLVYGMSYVRNRAEEFERKEAALGQRIVNLEFGSDTATAALTNALVRLEKLRNLRDSLAGNDEGIDEGYSIVVRRLSEALGE